MTILVFAFPFWLYTPFERFDVRLGPVPNCRAVVILKVCVYIRSAVHHRSMTELDEAYPPLAVPVAQGVAFNSTDSTYLLGGHCRAIYFLKIIHVMVQVKMWDSDHPIF